MADQPRVRIGLIGLGRHGSRYVTHILEEVPSAEIVAVSRRDEAQGRAFAQEYGVRFYSDAEALLNDPDVDAAIIVTPPHLHAPMTLAAAQAGKHVLCEKPMARTVAECRQMIEATQAAGVQLAVAQTLRYTPLLQAFRERLPQVGELYGLHACMRHEWAVHEWHLDPFVSGGGAVIEIGVHLFDTLRAVSGRKMERVVAGALDTRDVGSETVAAGMGWLEGNAFSNFDLAKAVDGRLLRFEAVGSDGQLIATVSTQSLEWAKGRTIIPLETPPNLPTIPMVVQDFCEAIQSDRTPTVTGEDGRYTLAVCEAVYRSLRSGKIESVQE